MYKRILIFTITSLILFGSVTSVFAQESKINIELPSVAVNSLLMEEYTYMPGKDVLMSLDIENISSSPNEFRYQLEILPTDNALTATSVARTVLSSSDFSERYVLRPKEVKRINISYPIPAYVRGTIVLKLTAMNDAGFEVYSKTLSLMDVRDQKLENTSETVLDNSGQVTPKITKTEQTNINTAGLININKIVFTQGNNSFEPKGDGSSYLLDETTDLGVEVSTDGSVIEKAALRIGIRNIHTGSTTEYIQSIQPRDVSAVKFTIPTTKIPSGIYDMTITPISKEKKELGPSRKINIGIEGIIGVIQSLTVDASLPVKKGDLMSFSAYWVPILQISKELTEDLGGDGKFNKPFSAKIFIEDEKGLVVGSTTLQGVTPEIFTELKAERDARNIFGRIEIYIGDELIGSYKKELQLEDINAQKKGSSLIYVYISVAILLILILIAVYVIRKRNTKSIIASLIIFSLVTPTVTTAQWTQFSTTSLTHLFPKDSWGDLSTTTWRQQNNTTGGYGGNWPAIVPYSRSSCTARTAATGATSNYVTQTLPLLSGNNKMYRWENSWQRVTQGGNIWYWVNKNTYGNGTTWPASMTTIPGVFSKSAFMSEILLDKSAARTDNLSTSESAPYNWKVKRPIRISATNGMGTNPVSALATTTYANLPQWINAWFNVRESIQINQENYMQYFGYDDERSMEDLGLLGSFTALPADFFAENNSYNFSSSNLATRKTALGITNNTQTIVPVEAGEFKKYIYTPVFGNNWWEDKIEQESLPGIYTMFNFLYTARDEANVTITTGLPQYNCFSANLQVWRNNYEVVGNSHIDVVMFYDENRDGIRQDNEYSIVNSVNEFDGGWPIDAVYGGGTYNTTCFAARELNINLMSTKFYKGNIDYPIHYYKSGSLSPDAGKIFKPLVRTSSQVTDPAFLVTPYGSNVGKNLTIGDASGVYGNDSISLASDWAKNSAGGSDNIRYDSQGRLLITPGDNVCGQTMSSLATSLSAAMDNAYEIEVRDFPVPSSVANATTSYWKIPVNSEISTQYIVSTDTSLLPTGWSTTTPPQTITLAAGSQNQHYPVYLGVTYNANGVCGSAITTPSGSPVTSVPSSNLCSAGSSTAVVSNGQGFTWSCNGYGTGSTASCTKPVCGGTNSYYCDATNSCVASAGACQIAGVCGSATTQPGRSTAGQPTQPSTSLCSAGTLNGLVADGGASSFVWTCSGTYGGATSPTCSQPKCSSTAGLQYCAALNECRTDCPVTSTSTLIFDAKLTPRVVRKSTDQCIFSWKTSSSADLPVSCTLNGVPLGGALPTIQRNVPVSVGSHTLSCTNTEQDQSTTTKCLLNPSYKEI